MPAMIKIHESSPTRLTLFLWYSQPNYSENRHQIKRYDEELRELKQRFANAGLIEGVDYFTDDKQAFKESYQPLVFSGASNVLKALFCIPEDMIRFESMYQHYMFTEQQLYRNKRYQYAIKISANNCFVSHQKFVKQANEELFLYLKDLIKTMHDKVKPSIITIQLDADLAYIQSLKNESVFGTQKYYLAFSSLHNAFCRENIEKMTTKQYLIRKGPSILSPEYEKSLKLFCTAFTLDYDYTKSKSDLVALYDKYVRSRTEIPDFFLPVVTQPSLEQKTANVSVESLNSTVNSNLVVPVLNESIDDAVRHFLLPLKTVLENRKIEIEKRVLRHQWFQSTVNNNAKLVAINNVVEAFDAQQSYQELIEIINKNRNALTQSTSTLPMFFRAQVTTADLLRSYDAMLIPAQ